MRVRDCVTPDNDRAERAKCKECSAGQRQHEQAVLWHRLACEVKRADENITCKSGNCQTMHMW